MRAEGVPGGFAAVYGVLRALEDSGRARRGYFVAGLGAAQFALPGAVDRLRALRPSEGVNDAARDDARERHASSIVLAATDPAQPYGAALAWPAATTPGARPQRAAGAFVVLHDGEPAAYLERGGRTVITFADPEHWVDPLTHLVKDGRLRQLELTTVDELAVRDSPAAPALARRGLQGHLPRARPPRLTHYRVANVAAAPTRSRAKPGSPSTEYSISAGVIRSAVSRQKSRTSAVIVTSG